VAYDVFRLPFVFAKQWAIESVAPPMQLFTGLAAGLLSRRPVLATSVASGAAA